jgi:hypothetical protein
MRSFAKKAFSKGRPLDLPTQVRRDQLAMVRYLIAAALLIFTWSLFQHTGVPWVQPVLLGAVAFSFILGAFAMGKFQRGQQWLLRQLPTPFQPMEAAFDPALRHHVQAYVSLDEATVTGWSFFEQVGRYGAWKIPRWAHDGTTWFEYQGLDQGAGLGLRDDERVFGLFVYRQVPPEQNPDHPSPWGAVQPSA